MLLRNVLTIVQLISAFAIVGLVLLQRGKGADAGAGFGAGASGTVFGARGASTALSRATAVMAALFMILSLALTYVGAHATPQAQHSILDEPAADAKSKPAAALGTQPPAAPLTAPAPAPVPAQTPAPK